MTGVRRKPVVFIGGRLEEIPDGDVLDGVFEPNIGTSVDDITISTEDILIAKDGTEVVTLLPTNDAGVKPVEVKNKSAASIVVTAGAETIDGHTDGFLLEPGASFKFVPDEEDGNYVVC